jgi:hypothetical protein
MEYQAVLQLVQTPIIFDASIHIAAVLSLHKLRNYILVLIQKHKVIILHTVVNSVTDSHRYTSNK